jgi:O-antigen/teichoic acid export membrane protein
MHVIASPRIRSAGWALMAQGARFVLQGASFVFLARALGASAFGLFAGTLALISVLVPFCGLGTTNLLIRYAVQNEKLYSRYLGNWILMNCLSAVLLSIFAGAIAPLILGQSFRLNLFLLLLLSEMFLLRPFDLAWQAFQIIERLDLSAALHIAVGTLRLVAVVVYIQLAHGRQDPAHATMLFAKCYVCTSVICAIFSSWMLHHYMGSRGRPTFSWASAIRNIPEGFAFAIGGASRSIYSDIDKTMLTSWSTLEISGAYSAGYRIISMAFIPVQAVLMSTQASIYRRGGQGAVVATQYARRLVLVLVGYGAAIGIFLSLVSPVLPWILGKSFHQTSSVLLCLAWMPMVQAVHFLAGDTLASIGKQVFRSICQVSVAVLNVALNLVLIPKYAWLGAVCATYISEGSLAIALVLILLFCERKAKAADENAASDRGLALAAA